MTNACFQRPKHPATAAAWFGGPSPSVPRRTGGITPRRAGFTLTELLIVVGIIVLLVIIALPAWHLIGGENSIDGAQNQVSALLARARTDAIALQEDRGVMFYRDAVTGRVGALIVRARPEVWNTTSPVVLDVLPDRDGLLLPKGVGLQTFIDNQGGGSNEHYLGFNKQNISGIPSEFGYGGVILFDAQGKVESRPYAFVASFTPVGGSLAWTDMGKVLYADKASTGGPPNAITLIPTGDPFNSGSANYKKSLMAQVGFVLYEEEKFISQNFTDDDPRVTNSGNDATEEKWLDENGRQFLVNRYNGTLIRAGEPG